MSTEYKIIRNRTVKKAIVVAFCVSATFWVLGCTALYHVMRQSPDRFGRVMARIPGPVPFLAFPFETLWMRARAGTLQVGSLAPDFSLTKLDESAQLQLSSFKAEHRPVALVFGSYT